MTLGQWLKQLVRNNECTLALPHLVIHVGSSCNAIFVLGQGHGAEVNGDARFGSQCLFDIEANTGLWQTGLILLTQLRGPRRMG